jgi:hypothetical protein
MSCIQVLLWKRQKYTTRIITFAKDCSFLHNIEVDFSCMWVLDPNGLLVPLLLVWIFEQPSFPSMPFGPPIRISYTKYINPVGRPTRTFIKYSSCLCLTNFVETRDQVWGQLPRIVILACECGAIYLATSSFTTSCLSCFNSLRFQGQWFYVLLKMKDAS